MKCDVCKGKVDGKCHKCGRWHVGEKMKMLDDKISRAAYRDDKSTILITEGFRPDDAIYTAHAIIKNIRWRQIKSLNVFYDSERARRTLVSDSIFNDENRFDYYVICELESVLMPVLKYVIPGALGGIIGLIGGSIFFSGV